ncbi:MAG: ankyrin repeat domain-containing protein [Armatimonadota bacterium]
MLWWIKLIILVLLIVFCGTAYSGEIHKAAANGNIRQVKQIINKSLSLVNAQDQYGMTPLMYAIERGNGYIGTSISIDTIKYLLDNGADPNIRNKAGKSAVLFLSGDGDESEYLEVARLLVKHKADPNAADNNGSTVLHRLVKWGPDGDTSKIIRYLISKGAKINARDKNNATPLHSAIGAENEPDCMLHYVKLLIELGADVNAKTKGGKTPLAMAQTIDDWTVYDSKTLKPAGSGKKILISILTKHHAHL